MANNNAPLSRGDVISDIAAETQMPNAQVDQVIRAFEGALMRQLSSGGEVRMAGLGSFRVTSRKARAGRNPATGAPIQIAASKGVGFKAAKALKDAVGGAKKGAKSPAKAAAKPAAKVAPVKAAPVKAAPVKAAPIKAAPIKAAPAKAAPKAAAKPAAKPAAKAAPVKAAPAAKAAPAKAAPAKAAAKPAGVAITKAEASKGGKKGGKK